MLDNLRRKISLHRHLIYSLFTWGVVDIKVLPENFKLVIADPGSSSLLASQLKRYKNGIRLLYRENGKKRKWPIDSFLIKTSQSVTHKTADS